MLLKHLIDAALATLLAVALWMAGPTPAGAAGTTPLALAVQRDSAGNEVPGCLLYFYVAGSVATPQSAYVDFGLTTPLANPLPCDQAGRVPMHWLADGLIHIRLTTSTGTPIVDTTMQVLGPSSGGGGGGGGTVDPTSIMATGDLKARYGTGALAGFVRANGLTLGNATSGATERANADTQALWIALYNADPNLAVSGGRTGNALNDYNANKQLTLPDWRGRALAFLDDMGNSAAGRLTASYFGTNATVLGASGGVENTTLSLAQLPTGITVTGTVTVDFPGTVPYTNNFTGNTPTVSTGSLYAPYSSTSSWLPATSASKTNTLTSNNTSGNPHRTVQPTMLATIYIKL